MEYSPSIDTEDTVHRPSRLMRETLIHIRLESFSCVEMTEAEEGAAPLVLWYFVVSPLIMYPDETFPETMFHVCPQCTP